MAPRAVRFTELSEVFAAAEEMCGCREPSEIQEAQALVRDLRRRLFTELRRGRKAEAALAVKRSVSDGPRPPTSRRLRALRVGARVVLSRTRDQEARRRGLPAERETCDECNGTGLVTPSCPSCGAYLKVADQEDYPEHGTCSACSMETEAEEAEEGAS